MVLAGDLVLGALVLGALVFGALLLGCRARDSPRGLFGASVGTGRRGRPTKGREGRRLSPRLRPNNDSVMDCERESWELLSDSLAISRSRSWLKVSGFSSSSLTLKMSRRRGCSLTGVAVVVVMITGGRVLGTGVVVVGAGTGVSVGT